MPGDIRQISLTPADLGRTASRARLAHFRLRESTAATAE
jgi:hypothetical protein